jgi:hypothetical protein
MTTVYIADTGVFVRCGGPDNEKSQRLRHALREAGVSLLIPQRVYDELGGDAATTEYPSGNVAYSDGFEEGWLTVADELDYTESVVSTVMDAARRFIAAETDRDEDLIEKADTALLGLAVQVLASGQADHVVLLTTDKPAGRAAETLLPKHGFDDQITYQYVSVEYLETISAEDFSR